MPTAEDRKDCIAPMIPIMVRRIVEQFAPLKIILFGSRGRGDHSPDSDVDLLVVLPAICDNHRSACAIRRALKDIQPVAKDIVVTTPDDLAAYGDLPCYVFYPALQEGEVLYERPAPP